MIMRCRWCTEEPLYQAYHDKEWGVPVHDDRQWLELLTLEGAQTGIGWFMVLRMRDTYRRRFHGFDASRVARLEDTEIDALLQDPGLIRNRQKLMSVRDNARGFVRIQQEHGSFDRWIWDLMGGEPRINHWRTLSEVPASTKDSDRLSRALRDRGFRFVGSITCYALMQAGGLVMDHATECFRHRELSR